MVNGAPGVDVSIEAYSKLRDKQNELIVKHYKFVTLKEILDRLITENIEIFDIPHNEIIGRRNKIINEKNFRREIKQ